MVRNETVKKFLDVLEEARRLPKETHTKASVSLKEQLRVWMRVNEVQTELETEMSEPSLSLILNYDEIRSSIIKSGVLFSLEVDKVELDQFPVIDMISFALEHKPKLLNQFIGTLFLECYVDTEWREIHARSLPRE